MPPVDNDALLADAERERDTRDYWLQQNGPAHAHTNGRSPPLSRLSVGTCPVHAQVHDMCC